MKDGKFESQKEIYEALIAGKKVRLNNGKVGRFLFLFNGNIFDNDNCRGYPSFITPEDWSLYEEPKKTKKYIKRLVRYGQSVREEYLLERTPNIDIIKSYDDYILIDEDGNLVEETNG